MGSWMVGSNISGNSGWLLRHHPSNYLDKEGWKYWDGSAWNSSDNTLQVTEGEPRYPDTVTISSSGGAANSQAIRLGIFRFSKDTSVHLISMIVFHAQSKG